jgi:Zn-dependent protease
MTFDGGYLQIATVRGIPIRLHWTLPVGMLVLGGFSPAIWLAFLVLILGHEAGHALLARRYGFRVENIDVTGFGGLCRWTGSATEHQRSVIAWGGVAAQAVLLVATLAVVLVAGWPTSWAGSAFVHVFTRTNAILMVLNLLPFAPFDGAQAWLLPRRWLERLRGGGPRFRLGQR